MVLRRLEAHGSNEECGFPIECGTHTSTTDATDSLGATNGVRLVRFDLVAEPCIGWLYPLDREAWIDLVETNWARYCKPCTTMRVRKKSWDYGRIILWYEIRGVAICRICRASLCRNSVALHSPIEGTAMDAEKPGSLGFIATSKAQGLMYVPITRCIDPDGPWLQNRRQMFCLNGLAGAENTGTLDDIHQFSNISSPVVLEQRVHGLITY
jgi:hypothetical protein